MITVCAWMFSDSTRVSGAQDFDRVNGRSWAGTLGSEAAETFVSIPPVGGIIWKYPVGEGIKYTAPAIGENGVIYLGGPSLFAFNQDGSVAWSASAGNGVFFGMPVIGVDGTIYVASTGYYLCAFSPEGKMEWSVRGVRDFGAFFKPPAIGPDGTIYIGDSQNKFYAISPQGVLKWSQWITNPLYVAPVDSPAAIGEDRIYFSSVNQLHALRPTGESVWIRDSAGCYAPVIGADGNIYIGTDDGLLQSIYPDGNRRWSFSTGAAAGGASPVISADGTIYMGCSNSNMFSLTRHGELNWKFAAGGAINSSASLAADGTIYFGASDRYFYGVSAEGILRWKTECAGRVQSASVVGTNGTIYFTCEDGNLYAVRGDASLADSVWPTFSRNNARTGANLVKTQPPIPPTGLSASQGIFPTFIRLQWASAEWAHSYEILRNTIDNVDGASQIASNILATTTYYDGSALLGQRYYYWVRSVNAVGKSGVSEPAVGYYDLELSENEAWSTDFYVPGNYSVFGSGNRISRVLTTAPNGDLLAGGGFYNMAEVPGTTALARWNGKEWGSMGAGLRVQDTVFTILTNGAEIYIGGAFTNVGGVAATNIARWDGTNWQPFGGGLVGGAVRAMTVWKGTLYAAGAFTRTSGQLVKYLAQWNGSAWSDVNSGAFQNLPRNTEPLRTLGVFEDSLYAGGAFTVNGVGATNLARWDGNVWHPVGRVPGMITALGEYKGALIAGIEVSPREQNSNLVWRWEENQWRPLAPLTPTGPGFVTFLQGVADYLYAGGPFAPGGFARWDGTKWEKFTEVSPSVSLAAAFKDAEIYLSTALPSVMSSSVNGIYHFDGREWSSMGGGLANASSTIRTILPSAEGILVGGGFDGQTCALWTGKHWEPKSLGKENVFWSITHLTRGTDRIYATGNTDFGGAVCAFDGTNWTRVGEHLPSEGQCVAERGMELFVGHQLGILRWDGNAWSNLAEGLEGPVNTMALAGKDLFAGGAFAHPRLKEIKYLARWDGQNWFPVGGGLNAPVKALAVHGRNLYVGGYFSRAGDLSVPTVAIWDGANWTRPATELVEPSAGVYCLETSADGSLYVGGELRPYIYRYPLFLAKWDGARWNPLGFGLNGPPAALKIEGSNLYAAGDFTSAGGHSSTRFAHWRIPDPLLVPIATSPRAVSQGSRFEYTIHVKNTGEVIQENCTLIARIPEGTRFILTDGISTLNGDVITWRLPTIAARGEATVTLEVEAIARDSFICLNELVASDGGGKIFRAAAAYTSVSKNDRRQQNITLVAPQIWFGTNAVPLQAASDSGLPILLEIVEGPGSIVGQELVPSGEGMILIRASQAGNEDFVAATPVELRINVSSPPQISASATSEGRVRLSWPAIFQDFRIESAPSVNGPWEKIKQDASSKNEFLIEAESGVRQTFFRLQK